MSALKHFNYVVTFYDFFYHSYTKPIFELLMIIIGVCGS